MLPNKIAFILFILIVLILLYFNYRYTPMPKIKKTLKQKAKDAVLNHGNLFSIIGTDKLVCNTCKNEVNCQKQFNIDSHIKSAKHQSFQKVLKNQPKLVADKGQCEFSLQITEAFLSADIPLHKLRNPNMVNLFKSMNHPLPSETTCRAQIDKILEKIIQSVKYKILNEQIFLIFDETCHNGMNIGHTLVGILKEPSITYLIKSTVFHKALCAADVSIEIDQILKEIEIEREKFVLFLSDAARYMVSAGTNLKLFYPNLFHVTCVSHLMHNAAEIVRSKFPDVDKLISSVKASTIKNKERRKLFIDIGYPPAPVITRWGSWISAAMYYAKKLPEVKNIFANIESNGVLIANVKKSLESANLVKNLATILDQYSCLTTLSNEMEGSSFTIKEAIDKIESIDLKDDFCGISDYIKKRLELNGISLIKNMSNPSISPLTYQLLLNCQPTSAAVERSFSLLNSMLTKNRNFNETNIQKYVVCQYNSFML